MRYCEGGEGMVGILRFPVELFDVMTFPRALKPVEYGVSVKKIEVGDVRDMECLFHVRVSCGRLGELLIVEKQVLDTCDKTDGSHNHDNRGEYAVEQPHGTQIEVVAHFVDEVCHEKPPQHGSSEY